MKNNCFFCLKLLTYFLTLPHTGIMSFRGAVKCCVCKRFCSKTNKVCPGCNQHCHDKCRQSLCCNPCNSCWSKVLHKRSCVCRKSLRSLGVFVDSSRLNPLTPSTTGNITSTPLPAKRNADGRCRSVGTINSVVSSTVSSANGSARRGLTFNENEEPIPPKNTCQIQKMLVMDLVT